MPAKITEGRLTKAMSALGRMQTFSLILSKDHLGRVAGKESNVMKFASLKSRGGDYMVVAQNVAWLRSHENGQTKVGMVGSDPIQVAGKSPPQSRQAET
jgi:hypothetical protein